MDSIKDSGDRGSNGEYETETGSETEEENASDALDATTLGQTVSPPVSVPSTTVVAQPMDSIKDSGDRGSNGEYETETGSETEEENASDALG
ncbi:unnamed protein product [Ilex paraguariensis]|uniref:Uncharacterized protein n=1 Tax=Ilex paraguariensis TaxID=185542 RepID=A0ABC8TPX6_9AQUA